MKMADCCIVLCNRECVDPSEEDAENIMRYELSIKNKHVYLALKAVCKKNCLLLFGSISFQSSHLPQKNVRDIFTA